MKEKGGKVLTKEVRKARDLEKEGSIQKRKGFF